MAGGWLLGDACWGMLGDGYGRVEFRAPHRSRSRAGSAGSLQASGIPSGNAEMTGRGSVAGYGSSPLQMTHIKAESVTPTTQWCSAFVFLSAAQFRRGTHSKPYERRQARTIPAESTEQSTPPWLKPSQWSVAPSRGQGASQ